MRPWIKRTLYGLFGASVLLGGLAACGHRHEGHGWQMSAEDQARWRARMVDRVSGKLELDAGQKQRLGVLADRLHEQRLALVGSGEPRAQVQALVAGSTFDRAAAQALVAGKAAALNGKSPEVIAAMADFYDGLRPEQQARVRDFMQRRHHGWWQRG